jgi:hypothetical protein
MLVDELLESLATMPSTACVIVFDADNPGAQYRPGEVRYHYGQVEIRLDFDRWRPGAAVVDDEADDDEADDDVPVNTTDWQRVRRAAAHVYNGIDEGYPLCCVLFFACVWFPLVRIPALRPEDGFRGRLWDART